MVRATLAAGSSPGFTRPVAFTGVATIDAQFKIKSIRCQVEMVSEDSAEGLQALRGELCHQLTNRGAEYLHHLTARNSEANDGGGLDLDLGLNSL